MRVPLKVCLFAQFSNDVKVDEGVPLPDFITRNDFVRTLPSLELSVALLLELAKGENSFYGPYLAILPRSMDSIPLTWNEHEMRLIVEDSCFALIVSRLRDICMAYCMMCEDPKLRAVLGSYEQFAWSVCVVNSRQNPLPSPQGRSNKVALIPAFDMCNHDPDGAQIMTEFSWATKCFDCRAHKTFEANEEFTIFYGPRPDVELLLYSGFVASPPGINPYTTLILPFNLCLQEAPDLAKVKKVLVDKVPGIVPTGDENFYLVSLGGTLGESALRMFARAAAAKSKEQAQAALKKKLENPGAGMTDQEKEYARKSLEDHKKRMSSLPKANRELCRPPVVRAADDFTTSCLAVLQRVENKLMG
jgi:hypothetical protein